MYLFFNTLKTQECASHSTVKNPLAIRNFCSRAAFIWKFGELVAVVYSFRVANKHGLYPEQ